MSATVAGGVSAGCAAGVGVSGAVGVGCFGQPKRPDVLAGSVGVALLMVGVVRLFIWCVNSAVLGCVLRAV